MTKINFHKKFNMVTVAGVSVVGTQGVKSESPKSSYSPFYGYQTVSQTAVIMIF